MYVIGYVVKPQGIKGELKINPISPYPERFEYLSEVYIRKDSIQIYSIEHARITDRFVFLKFHQINSRTEAEEFRGCELLVEKDALIALETDEYFVHDLIGCDVKTEEGKTIGQIHDIWQNAGNDIYIINDSQGREILLPAVKDILKNIDIKNRIVTIHLIDGLID
jgi:16S rRNA processing protein RimM